MIKRFLIVWMVLVANMTTAQVRVGTLVIKKNQKFELQNSDILVADTLIMMDSSTLVLNKLKRENYVRVGVAIFGNHVTIDGRGINGARGRDGRDGAQIHGPCQDGLPGRPGGKGLDGGPAVNLFLYLDSINVTGKLIIDLTGGDGGRGGNGGTGGGGSSGTKHCQGGNGGNGGDAGAGGNGANGGTLTVGSTAKGKFLRRVGSEIVVLNYGGNPGDTGHVGYRGLAGLGPKHGKNGQHGLNASFGRSGQKGKVVFEQN